jgi:hypothetical protein
MGADGGISTDFSGITKWRLTSNVEDDDKRFGGTYCDFAGI